MLFFAGRGKSAADSGHVGVSEVEKWRIVGAQSQGDIIGMFPKIVVPQNGWFIMDNLIKMDDLVVPLFSETPIGCWLA